MQTLLDFWLRSTVELLSQAAEQCTADQRQVSQEIGIAGTGPVLSHQRVPPPVITNLHSCPMAADQVEPMGPRVLLRLGAREVVARLGAPDPGLLYRALAAHHDQRSGVREVGFERLDGEGVDGPCFHAPVPGSGFGKKGVCLSPSSA